MTELDPARVKELLAKATQDLCEQGSRVLQRIERLEALSDLQALAPALTTAWLASLDHIAALETPSRALVAKLEECGPYLPHGSVRVELDALIAVLKSSEEG